MVDSLDEPFPNVILDLLRQMKIKNLKDIQYGVKNHLYRFSIFRDFISVMKGKVISVLCPNCILDTIYNYFYLKLNKMGFNEMGFRVCFGTLIDILKNPRDWNWLYNSLSDRKSKENLIKVTKLRTLAPFLGIIRASEILKVKFDYNSFLKFLITIKEWNLKNLILARLKKKIWLPKYYRLNRYILPLKPLNLLEIFIIEAYKYKNIIIPKPGEYVLDIGASVGDTAIWFVKYMGEDGKIFAFEPNPNAYRILQHVIKMNNLEQTIYAYNFSIGSHSTTSNNNIYVSQISIDDFVRIEQVHEVDFIKIDIEGAEVNALKGARNTIKQFSPKLAIASYHYPREIIDVVKFLKELNTDYRVYLKHEWFLWNGTNIFAI